VIRLQVIKIISTFHNYQLEYQINEFLVHCVEMNIVASYKNFFYGKDYEGSDDSFDMVSRFNCAITIEVQEDRIKDLGKILQSESPEGKDMYKDFVLEPDKE